MFERITEAFTSKPAPKCRLVQLRPCMSCGEMAGVWEGRIGEIVACKGCGALASSVYATNPIARWQMEGE